MITVFQGLANPILYMLLFIAAGFVLGKLKLLPKDAALVLSKLESYLFIPAMILNAFIHNCTWESVKANYPAILLSAALEMVLLIISRPLSGLFAKGGYERNLYRYELIYPNTGFFGAALVRAVITGDVAGLFEPLTHPTFVIWASFLGVFCILLSAQFMAYMLSHMQIVQSTAFNSASTLISIIAGALILGEPLYWYPYVCGALILAGVVGLTLAPAVESNSGKSLREDM